MSTGTSTSGSPHATSWAAATWITPVVPGLWALVVLQVGGKTGIGETETGGFGAGLVLALVIAALGAGLTRVPNPGARGVGVGLFLGGLACSVPSVWVLVQ